MTMLLRVQGGVCKFLLVPPPKSVMSSYVCPTYSTLQGLPYSFWPRRSLCLCCWFRMLRYLYSVRPPYPAPHWHLGLLCRVSMPTLTPGSSPNWPTTISWWEKWEKKYTRLITKTDTVIYTHILSQVVRTQNKMLCTHIKWLYGYLHKSNFILFDRFPLRPILVYSI